jgi:hypothetical protein
MRYYLALLVLLIALIIFIFRINFTKDGFVDAQTEFTERQLTQYNDIGLSLVASNRRGILGNSGDAILNTQGINAGINAGPSKKYPLATAKDSLWKSIDVCEAINTQDCSKFDDPDFDSQCGMCLDTGTNSLYYYNQIRFHLELGLLPAFFLIMFQQLEHVLLEKWFQRKPNALNYKGNLNVREQQHSICPAVLSVMQTNRIL